MKILFSPFGGICPRMQDYMLGPLMATQAHDVKLRNGVLEPWNENCRQHDTVEGAQSFHVYGCCHVSWTDIVTAADLSPDWHRFYIAGREGNGLEAVELACDCEPTYYTGGVPAPTDAPEVSCAEECSRDADARSYVYTYVNKWGEESAPSPASNVVRVEDGTTVTVSGIADPPDGYGIVSVNLYRASTGFRAADGKIQKPLTAYLYLTTLSVPLETTTFVDSVKSIYLGAALETQDNRMPPDDMTGVVSIKDQIRLVGWRKNHVYMSERFELHNWPAKYDLTLDHCVVHMGELNSRLYVSTDSAPYIIDVSSCNDASGPAIISVDTPLPDIGCYYANGAVMTPHGLFYSSPIGIILLTENGSWSVVTAKWFGEDEWRKILPDHITMAYYEGYLYFSTPKATFLLDINGSPYGNNTNGDLVTLTEHPIACETTNTGEMLLLYDDGLYRWNGSSTPREWIWQSRPIMGVLTGAAAADGDGSSNDKALNAPRSKGTGTIDAEMQTPRRECLWTPTSLKLFGAGKATLYDSRKHAVFSRYLGTERPVRIARCGRHLWYILKLQSRSRVDFVDIGTSFFTLSTGV